jgi:hypothetical protein
MTLPTKITVIGAGSASFGENTLSAIMRSKKLRGSTLALVDRNAESLEIVRSLANRLNAEWEAGFVITAYTIIGKRWQAATSSSMQLKSVRAKVSGAAILRSRLNMGCGSLIQRTAGRRLRARGAQHGSHHADRARYGTGLPGCVVCQFHEPDDTHM